MGIRMRKMAKYSTEASCPMMINGCSTGIPPIHVRISTSAIKVQNRNCVRGRKVSPRCLDVWRSGTSMSTRIENSSAKTPPSLFGIERRMA